jgi:uncharacterized membrane protein YkgB
MSHDQATGMMADELRSSRTTAIAALVARCALVIVIAWFGAMKSTYYESHGISPLVANSRLMSWIYNIMSISAFVDSSDSANCSQWRSSPSSRGSRRHPSSVAYSPRCSS